MNNTIEISVIIVNYKVKNELFSCISSILKSNPKSTFEIIVVDNDEVKVINKDLMKKFPFVIYVPNPVNSGWGSGVNLGVKKANGKYLYLLNPDTLLLNNTLDKSLEFYKTHPRVGVVASTLLDRNRHQYSMQGTGELTPLIGVIVYSLINKLLPNNLVSKKFFKKKIDRSKPYKVEIAPLTASMISLDVFQKAEYFDSNIFLYFEEYDLQRRTNNMGYENYILPDARVIHFWESSTKQITGRNIIMEKSRKYYFEKHFGKFQAFITEFILRRNLYMLVVEYFR